MCIRDSYDPLKISPFTAKDMLVKHAKELLGPDARLLDASRGGPNWQQRTVQCAWHVLGMYADYCHGGPRDHPAVRLLGGTDAVSYTHLDVYKRQAANCSGSLPAWFWTNHSA